MFRKSDVLHTCLEHFSIEDAKHYFDGIENTKKCAEWAWISSLLNARQYTQEHGSFIWVAWDAWEWDYAKFKKVATDNNIGMSIVVEDADIWEEIDLEIWTGQFENFIKHKYAKQDSSWIKLGFAQERNK